jgi:uncharacterized protein with PQ loop repeat
MIESVGYIGGLLLALSGLPQALKSLREGRTGDISTALLWMWVVGEGFMFVYTAVKAPTVPLLLNFGANFVLVGLITWYYYFPRAQKTARKVRLQTRRGKPRTLQRLGRLNYRRPRCP